MRVSDHRRLVKAGFLHRNICPSHILLGNQEVGRHLGVLIDFNSATHCENGKTPADNDTLVVSFTAGCLLSLDAFAG